MCHLESCQHENSGEWQLSCQSSLHLAPITKIQNVSSFREELNQTVMEMGHISTVRNPSYSRLLGLLCVCAQSLQSCPTLCNPLDCNPANSSVHEILQARILEWVAIPFSRGSSQGLNLGLLHCRQILHCLSHQGSPLYTIFLVNSVDPGVRNYILAHRRRLPLLR